MTSFPTCLAANELRPSSKEAGSISRKVPEKMKRGISMRIFITIRAFTTGPKPSTFSFFGKGDLFGKKLKGPYLLSLINSKNRSRRLWSEGSYFIYTCLWPHNQAQTKPQSSHLSTGNQPSPSTIPPSPYIDLGLQCNTNSIKPANEASMIEKRKEWGMVLSWGWLCWLQLVERAYWRRGEVLRDKAIFSAVTPGLSDGRSTRKKGLRKRQAVRGGLLSVSSEPNSYHNEMFNLLIPLPTRSARCWHPHQCPNGLRGIKMEGAAALPHGGNIRPRRAVRNPWAFHPRAFDLRARFCF